jgi:serine/threonine protein kinase
MHDRLAAALTGRYAIERVLGRGGMATLYLAEDLPHHRKVAIKVLPPEIGLTLGASRFLREIEVPVQHRNIVPRLDSGEVPDRSVRSNQRGLPAVHRRRRLSASPWSVMTQ